MTARKAPRAAARIRVLQQESERLAGESRTLLGDLRRLELDQQIGRERLRAAETDLETIDHLSDISVEVGASVGRSERVGLVAPVGLAPRGAAVLYFELRVDGRPVDPLQWLRSSP